MNKNKAGLLNFRSPGELSVIYQVTVSALILFFVFDALTKVLSTYSFDFYRASLIIRALYEIVFIYFIITHFNLLRMSLLTVVFCLLLIFISGQFFLMINEGYYGAFWEGVVLYNKYIFVFITYGAIYKLKDDQNKLNKCISILEVIFLINSIAVLLGPLTGFEFLKTYVGTDYRHGYMGFILAQNEATLYYFLAVSLAYYKRVILKMPSKSFFFICGAALILGTKGMYAYLTLLLLFHLLFYSKSKIWLIIFVGFISILAVRYIQSDGGKAFLIYFYNENAQRSWISMLLSGRDRLLENNFLRQSGQWGFINYFTGGQNVSLYATELDFFDLLLFFGILGTTIYLSFFFLAIFRFKATLFTIFFVFCYFLLAFLGGHFFSSAVNSLYLCLVSLFILQTQREHTYPIN